MLEMLTWFGMNEPRKWRCEIVFHHRRLSTGFKQSILVEVVRPKSRRFIDGTWCKMQVHLIKFIYSSLTQRPLTSACHIYCLNKCPLYKAHGAPTEAAPTPLWKTWPGYCRWSRWCAMRWWWHSAWRMRRRASGQLPPGFEVCRLQTAHLHHEWVRPIRTVKGGYCAMLTISAW